MAKKKNTPTRNEFELTKVKIKDGVVDVECSIKEVDGSISHINKMTIRCTTIAHPDLMRAIDRLKPTTLKALGLLDFQTVLNNETFGTEEKKGAKALKLYFDRLSDNISERMRISGVSISGEDKTLAIIISGVFNPVGKMKCAMNTPRIMLNADVFKTEAEIQAALDDIIEEVYCYLYEGKQAQASILDEEQVVNETAEA